LCNRRHTWCVERIWFNSELTMARLPTIGADDGNWGAVLNEFLEVSHNADGTLKSFVSIEDFQIEGATDYNQAFKDAINSGAGTIYIPDGDYTITETIVLSNSGQKIVGSSRSKTRIYANFQGGAVFEIQAPRCAITDVLIDSYPSSNRRNASPHQKVAPDSSVDGMSDDRGILLVQQPGSALTYTHIARCDIVRQPADGIYMAGGGSGTVIEQVAVTYCGGHGMYFDNGTKLDNNAVSRDPCGIVDIKDCIIQECWGHGVALATESDNTVYRFNLHNLDIFQIGLGDNGVNQPPLYINKRSGIAMKATNTRVTLCGINCDYAIVLGLSQDVVIESTRFILNITAGVSIYAYCKRIRVLYPFFDPTPPESLFEIDHSCSDIVIEGIEDSTQHWSQIDAINATSNIRLTIDGRRCFAIPGTLLVWYDEEMRQQTITNNVCDIQSKFVELEGEGDTSDNINQLRFTQDITIPNNFVFTLYNFQEYDILLLDQLTNQDANIALQGETLTLKPGESQSFICKQGICYPINYKFQI